MYFFSIHLYLAAGLATENLEKYKTKQMKEMSGGSDSCVMKNPQVISDNQHIIITITVESIKYLFILYPQVMRANQDIVLIITVESIKYLFILWLSCVFIAIITLIIENIHKYIYSIISIQWTHYTLNFLCTMNNWKVQVHVS